MRWVAVVVMGLIGPAYAEPSVDALESDAHAAAEAHLCETVRRDLADLANLAPARAEALRHEPAVSSCATPVPPPPATVPTKPVETSVSVCSVGVAAQPSLLIGHATGPIGATPSFLIGRVSLGVRIRHCVDRETNDELHVAAIGESAAQEGHRFYGVGVEAQVGFRVATGVLVGPRVSFVMLDGDHSAYWAGMRTTFRDIVVGADVLYATPRPLSQDGSYGVYGVIGLDGKTGATTTWVLSGIAALAALTILAFAPTGG